MKLTKKAAVKLSDHTPIAYLLSTSLASCNLKNGFRRFVPQLYVKITNPQRHKKRMLIVIHFNPSYSFLNREIFCKRQSKTTFVEPKQKYKHK